MTTTEDIIKASMSLARDAAEGRVSAPALDTELLAACRSLVGTVVGEADPLFDLQRDIARQVLACGGLSLDELREWETVLDQRSNGPESLSEAVEPPEPPDTPPGS